VAFEGDVNGASRHSNPNIEARNPKEIQNPNDQKIQNEALFHLPFGLPYKKSGFRRGTEAA